nr:PAS domain-containing protein [uncultured Dongia sp.]
MLPQHPMMPIAIDPMTARWAAEHADRRWALFLRFWQDLALRLGRLPTRRDLDPADLTAALLPSIFLIDILPADDKVPRIRFRFRLLGTEIMLHETVRAGSYLDELGSEADLSEIEQQYHAAMAGRIQLRAATLFWESRDKDHIGYHVLMLPLGSQEVGGHEVGGDDGGVAHLIGCAIYDDEHHISTQSESINSLLRAGLPTKRVTR